ncbi:DUF4342 domain-containing protein [Clostridium pasteurianum]|uniref:Translation elongation factor Ts n=1 Tax=Clostridium pasteurianum BC1 TaxID=86416 RepID=R4K3J0_CLOPA|nr:DUF4342 domain-containing protein [Clostridium pasteurianum]AGK96296.1 translation elongation factor Ts [Clostridium pasteurianum BC1]
MSVKVELIDELRKRANVSYEEAKEALEKCNGDLVEALIYLEKQNKVKSDEGSSFFNIIKKIIKKGNTTKFIIKKKDNIILSLPVTIVVIITVFAPYVAVPGLILALITGHRFRFKGKNGEPAKVNETLDKISNVVDTAKKKFNEDTDSQSSKQV